MNHLFARELRRTGRFLALLAAAFLGLWRHRRLPRNPSRAQSASWLHQSCIRGLRAIHVELQVEGELPAGGLIVSNHLSYLDIMAFSAALPCVFVSKAEVEQWPIFGRYARWSGTVFVRRRDQSDSSRANLDVGNYLQNGVPVILFPEGTTSDGGGVLRFHSTMLQPAIDTGALITPCAIAYEAEDADVRELCWVGDAPLVPHVLKLLGKKSIRARIVLGKPRLAGGERRELSELLHDEVLGLYRQLHPPRPKPALGPGA